MTNKMNQTGRVLSTICSVLFFLTSASLRAQEPEITKVPLDFNEPSTLILGMVQDHQGNIWMSHGGRGLFKYDGNNLIRFGHKANDPGSISSERLECIAIGQDGIIWIGSFLNGLIRFDPNDETFTTYLHDDKNPNSIRSSSIRAVIADKRGGIWVGTNTGLDYFNPETGIFQHTFTNEPDEIFLQKEHIRTLYIDKAGILWVGCGSNFYNEFTEGGLFRLDTENKKIDRYINNSSSNSLSDNRVRAIYEDSKGNFWVGAAGDGLHLMDRSEGTFTRLLLDPSQPEKLSRPSIGNRYGFAADQIMFISEDAKGFIWIVTFQGGINRYDPETKKVTHYGIDQPGSFKLPSNSYWCGLQTKDHLLWLSTWIPQEGPLIKVDPLSKHISKVALGKPIFSFIEGEQKNIYMGSVNEILMIDSTGDTQSVTNISNQGSLNSTINNLEKDDDGNLWITSGYGLHHYDVKTNTLKAYFSDGRDVQDFVNTTKLINQDSLLVGTNSGLFLLELTTNKYTKFPYTNPDTKLEENISVHRIFIDSYRRIWIGVQDNLVKQFVLHTGSYRDYHTKNVVDYLYDIFEHTDKSIYIGTWRIGFRKYDAEKDRFENVTDQIGILNNETLVYSINSEGDSILWLRSEKGLLRFNILSRAASVFGIDWGIDINTVSSLLFMSTDGEYYFGTNSGYLKFHPSNFESQGENPFPPFIGKLIIDDKVIPRIRYSTRSIQLPYNQNNIKLELGYVNYMVNPDEQYLQYRLIGYDDAWREGSGGELVSYYKLDPGKYFFQIKALDNYGKWNDTSFTVVITPPWWQTWWAYGAYTVIFIGGVFLVDRVQRRRLLSKAQAAARVKELQQAREIEKAYNELKITQTQLIQSEKMASLGELTAGIAHEIQNPLNFVNNFSEVSNELIDEMKEEFKKGDIDEGFAIADDIKQNLQKIHHHGQRASGIVKGMLDHSRTSSGQKEPTDINALADEYLRLAYHGFRAKDKSFNAEFNAELEPSLPKVNVVAQDIGRVLLNLINNAFYAVNERSKKRETGYVPTVTVNTRLTANSLLLIAVKDNGDGIPAQVLNKIFQPFFTTKPTGQGTGLGLSLSYDIVTKGHNGSLEVDTSEGVGTEFIIQLPVG